MFLNNDVAYSNSLRNQVLTALLLGVFTAFIIIFLKPFGAGQQQGTFDYQNLYFSGYGLLVATVYFLSFLLFDIYYRRFKKWQWAEELLFILFFISFTIFISHFYTELVINKNPSRINLSLFLDWFKIMFFSFGLVISLFAHFLRKYFAISNVRNTFDERKEKDKYSNAIITLKSDLKKETFTIDTNSIIYIKSEDNYVTIHYENRNDVKEKMIRISLTKIHKQLKILIKVHRSYLVNPEYIVKIKGHSQAAKLRLKQIDTTIPISKTHYSHVKSYTH
jgi:hypothetical protein